MTIQDEGEGEGGYTAESVISMYLSGFKKKYYGGKRCVFNEERNKGKVGQDRSGLKKVTKKSVGRLPTDYQGL